jgi:hypothetical protein
MSGKDKLSPIEFEAENGMSSEKPSVKHLENVAQEEIKAPRQEYWDSTNVVGANRSFPSDELASQGKDIPRPKFLRRRWQHVKRHWFLYSLGLLILLAIGLPVL